MSEFSVDCGGKQFNKDEWDELKFANEILAGVRTY